VLGFYFRLPKQKPVNDFMLKLQKTLRRIDLLPFCSGTSGRLRLMLSKLKLVLLGE